jgi:lipopolysaccharide transport system permease protein
VVELSSLKHYFDLVRYRSFVELKSEREQSYLGAIWWVLEPLLYLVVFYLVFEIIMQRGGEGFLGFLLCGLVFWRWFDGSIKKLSVSIITGANLISQVHIPKIILPLIDFLSVCSRFVFVLIVFLGFAFFYFGGMQTSWLIVPILIFIQGVFMLGLGGVLAAFVPYVPDFKKIVDNGLQLMFYMSGIFFDIGKLDQGYQNILLINPMAVLIRSYRSVFFGNGEIDSFRLLMILLLGCTLCVVAVFFLNRFDKQYPRLLSR